jgi:predicted ester cyclase
MLHGGGRTAHDVDANKARSRRLYEEVFGRGNLTAADDILAPAMISNGAGGPPTAGSESLKRQAVLLRTAFPDLSSELLDQLAEGDRVASRWRGRGTHTGPLHLPTGVVAPSGVSTVFDEIRIDSHADGRIVES